MDDRTKNRLGRHVLLRRSRRAGLGVGVVYVARDRETGAPGVVVLPGGGRDWWPRGSARVVVETGGSPPRVTLQVQARSAAGLEELPELLTRATAALGVLVKSRPLQRFFLAGGRPERRLVPAWAAGAAWVAGGIAAVALVVAAAVAARDVRPSEAQDVVTPGEPTAFLYTSGQMPEAPMPAAPFARQKRPPCDPKMEDEVVGGCWTRLAAVPPCPERAYEHGRTCYLPMLAEAPPGRSVTP